jgi:GNAT superfamily N-acetyltransferase
MSDPSFQIRRAVPADAAALAEFGARTFAEAFGPDNRPEDLAAYLASEYGVRQQTAELLDPDVITLVAESGGAWAAFAQVRRIPAPPCVTGESPVELRRFFVDRPWQGRGLAAPFMAAAQDAARELGGRTLWLSVWDKNPRAIAFYEKCGFRNMGEKDYWVGSDCQRDFVLVIGI